MENTSACVLTVHETHRISLPHPVHHGDLVFAEAALVARGPHDDRHVIPIPHVGAFHAGEKFPTPQRLIARPFPAVHVEAVGHVGISARKAVGLDVGLQNDVQSQLVAKLQKLRDGRIVRGAHRVDVVLLHEGQIAADILRADGPARFGIGVVMVDAAQLHGAPVDAQLPVRRHGNGAQTHSLHDDLTRGIEL